MIEGNRRLTALKLLNGEDIGQVSQKIQTALDRAIYNPNEVMVALYTERDDILNYLGNKHIAGVKPWGALAKARYSKQLFDKVNTDGNYSERIREVARAIGSRTDFISRALKALAAYEIAEEADFFELEGVNEKTVKFSLLSTALDYEGIQEFIYDNPDEEQENRTINEDALKELFSWMFEIHEEGKTRLGESRNLVQLSRVVANDVGLANFRRGLPLSQAYILSDGIDDEFDSIATKIQGGLRDANSIIAEVSYSEERASTVRSIAKQARQLRIAFENDDD